MTTAPDALRLAQAALAERTRELQAARTDLENMRTMRDNVQAVREHEHRRAERALAEVEAWKAAYTEAINLLNGSVAPRPLERPFIPLGDVAAHDECATQDMPSSGPRVPPSYCTNPDECGPIGFCPFIGGCKPEGGEA
jgi:hypothetical protein